jgi:TrmH family RNA methyltransferase
VQRLRRLLRERTAREEERAFVVEGPKVIDEALRAGAKVQTAFAAPGAPSETLGRLRRAGAEVCELEAGVMERVADATTPQPLAAIVEYVDVPLAKLEHAEMVVVCVDVRDPGNAGTIVRSAEASGAGGVVCCEGSVDVYNPKTVRASAGSLFHVPVVAAGPPTAVATDLGSWGFRRVATVVDGGTDYTHADLSGRVALLLGNEAHGLPAEVARLADEYVTIPLAGRTESLNVGMAASVLCFEAARQRRGRP